MAARDHFSKALVLKIMCDKSGTHVESPSEKKKVFMDYETLSCELLSFPFSDPLLFLSGKICKNAQCMHERLLRTFPYSQFEAVLPRRRNNAATVIECKEDLIFCSREIRAKKFLEAPKVLRLYFDGVFAKNILPRAENVTFVVKRASLSERAAVRSPSQGFSRSRLEMHMFNMLICLASTALHHCVSQKEGSSRNRYSYMP